MSSAQKIKSSTSAKAAKSSAPKKAAQATSTAKSTTGKTMAVKKSVVLKSKTAKKTASASAAAIGTFSGVRPRVKNPSTSAIFEAVNKLTKQAKALIEKSATATPQLPKKLTPFAGWTTNPTKDDIARVQKARKLFSVDNS